jgi:hypothetical protein
MTLENHLLPNNLFVVSTYTVPEIMGSGREVSNNTSLIWEISFNGQGCDLQIHHCI